MKLATHNGNFHTDDVFAIALLLELYPSAEVIRTRDQNILDTADIVVDVGRVYDPSKQRFDHHQKEAGVRPNGIVYSGFGLVWKHYGLTFCDNNKAVWQRIDTKLVQHIDANDNGQKTYTVDSTGVEPFTIDNLVSAFNPSGFDETEDNTHDERFSDMVKWALTVLVQLRKKEADTVAAEKLFKKLYATTPDERYIVLDRHLPFNAVLHEYPKLLYAVFPYAANGSWMLEAVRKDPNQFGPRAPLPQAWRGKDEAELVRLTGVSDITFCHATGFLCSCRSKEGAIALLNVLLQTQSS